MQCDISCNDFLDAEKHETFLQIDTMIFDGDGQAFQKFLNLFYATGLFLYPLKTSENLWFSDVSGGGGV